MKREIVFLVALLFTVVCYAAPPPDDVGQLMYETELVVCQDVSDVPAVMPGIAAQEVAWVYIGDMELFAGIDIYQERATRMKFAELPVLITTTNLIALNKPPSDDSIMKRYNCKSAFLWDNQHSNYGYPLSAN